MTAQEKISDSTAKPDESAVVVLPLPLVLKFIGGLGVLLAVVGGLISRFAITPEMDVIALELMVGGGVPACIVFAYGKWKLAKKAYEESAKST